MFFLPVRKDLIGCSGKVIVRLGQGGIDHGEFVGVGPDGFYLTIARDGAIRGADKFFPQTFDHRLNAPILP